MRDIFFHVKFFLKLTRYHDRVSMLSFMLFLDFSSDHWKFESLLLCFRKPYGENRCMREIKIANLLMHSERSFELQSDET
jgi:hypothetical protein